MRVSSRHLADLGYCRELAVPPGSLFEFSSRFVPRDQYEALLALYALLQAIGSIPRLAADDTVKWTKLKWWSEELARDPSAEARHPVVRALFVSGASAHLDGVLLQRLVHDAASQIDVAPARNEAEMFTRYAALGSTWILLELALHDASLDAQALRCLGAASQLYARVYELARTKSGDSSAMNWDLPLDLLAKYSVRQGIPLCDQFDRASGMLAQLVLLAGTWYQQGLSELKLTGQAAPCLHLQLRLALEQRWLGLVKRKRGLREAGQRRFGPVDAWFAWRFCRRLYKH